MKAILFAIIPCLAAAESGLDGWLRYAPLPQALASGLSQQAPSQIVALNASVGGPLSTAVSELQKGLQGILGKQSTVSQAGCGAAGTLVVTTVDNYVGACGAAPAAASSLKPDGFWLGVENGVTKILGQNERGALYGALEFLSMVAQGNLPTQPLATSPSAPIRWANQWDNMDDSGTHGSVERGYGGPSIFFRNGAIVSDLTRVTQYARLLASIRVNGIIVNNVNANANLLNDRNIDGLGRIAEAFRPYGVQVGISLNFASPQSLGGLRTFDPLDRTVVDWWTKKTDQIYKRIPDFAGYLVKANSEGQPGPMTYQRTLADGANMFAKALKPHGGVVMFRAFVYDQLQPSNWKADRANAAVDFFKPLDGKFDDNVVVQIKYGPIDFQVREPASPLFANLPKTSVAIELQITQEYLGQQCHLVYLPPLWKTILDFDLRADGKPTFVRDVLSGQRFNKTLGGYAGVVNVGTDSTWLGSHLAMSNLYAFGRMAWDPTVDIQRVLQDWSRLTFGQDQSVIDAITSMSMQSWPAYENYTGNLGIQTLTDILFTHYGPNPASQDNNGWGQWTRADRNGIGMDRTVSNGTGNAGQYPAEVAAMYEKVESTPDDLLLWFHHVKYTQRLKSGKTVMQHFYDAHYAGAETAQTFAPLWQTLKGKVDDERFDHVLYRLKYQAGHSIVWRDAICTFYNKLSGIADEKGRFGEYPWRIEAESMTLSGYRATSVTPAETASGGRAITVSSGTGTASTKLKFPSGTYDVAVNYFDVNPGKARWQIAVNDKTIGEWQGDIESKLGKDPSDKLDGHSAARITFPNVTIAQGDTVKITGSPNGNEGAPLDYISFLPSDQPFNE